MCCNDGLNSPEIGTHLDVPMPNIGSLLGLTRVFGRVHGLYPRA